MLRALEQAIMRLLTRKNIDLDSALIHGILSFIVISGLLNLISDSFQWSSLIILFSGVLSAIYFGWKLGGWYIRMEKEKWLFEPYVATLVITILASITSGVSYSLVTGFASSGFALKEIFQIIGFGIFMGVYGFLLSSPVTVPFGILIGLYLYKYGSYST